MLKRQKREAAETGSGLISGHLRLRLIGAGWPLLDLGRPGQRKVDCGPSRSAVLCCQTVSPKGIPLRCPASSRTFSKAA
jgi:hypothetical protein